MFDNHPLMSTLITSVRDLNRLANGVIIRNRCEKCDTSAGPDQGVHFVKTPLGWLYSDPKGKPTTWELFPSDAIHLPVQVIHRVSESEDVSEITENSPHTRKDDSEATEGAAPSFDPLYPSSHKTERFTVQDTPDGLGAHLFDFGGDAFGAQTCADALAKVTGKTWYVMHKTVVENTGIYSSMVRHEEESSS
ncbi:hypothetical protein ET08_253 [Mycobacterium phage ET08]|uniref:Uncharacterized protein n=3 Tax=Bixzunavirus Bxz1 TaxID=2006134 RepID=C9DAH9_9CAUD|nr:hypothetical protein ET08_253 [Mycobacterium phage ET08]ACU41247.1 hypothetical protein ET08_253 [Mycobacterium phage ET08]AEJ94992.1 hypothetical protein GHOST_266 [Mycobacterium phage Ghost]ANT41769.1 hypothetical protein PBI_LITTLETON_271 [Mycobacterium phage Littleton]